MRLYIVFLLLGLTALGQSGRAGAAKRLITPDLKAHGPVYLAGFGQNRVATGVHDELYTRCFAVSEAARRPLVLCGVDSIGLFLEDTDAIRAKVPEADVVVAALHHHEAPDTMGLWGPSFGRSGINDRYNEFVVEQTVAAAREAVANLKPATFRLAKANHPDLPGFIHDSRPPVVTDTEVTVLQAVGRRGEAIGSLVNWCNHPETVGSKNTLITTDYVGYLITKMEANLGGVAVFVNGAVGGMQSSLGATVVDPQTRVPAAEDSFRKAQIIGERVAELAVEALGKSPRVEIRSVEFRQERVRVPMENPAFLTAAKAGLFRGRKVPAEDGTATTWVGFARIEGRRGPLLEVAMVPGELYPELSVGGVERFAGADFPDAAIEPAIKRDLMSAPFRMLIGLANDEIGYLIPKAEWDNVAPWLKGAERRWYGEVNSVGSEATPILMEAIRRLAKPR
jgi:hypothetical protein